MMFSNLAIGRNNNFLLLRLIAALAVIVSHSYPIVLGVGAEEPLQRFGPTLGTIAVWAFFGISGFLIFKSFERRSIKVFAAARAKRIFPALIVVSTLSVCVIGPIFTNLSLETYASSRGTWEYIPRALSLKWVSFALPGVFAGNPYAAVNGPLWTLYYEVFCYVALAISGVTGLLKRFPLFIILATCLYGLAKDTIYAPLCLAFFTGMVFYRYRDHIAGWMFVIPWIFVPFTIAALPAAVCSTALWLAAIKPIPFTREDYSYGLYIYGWPIQEILVHQLPGISPTGLTILAVPLALICAACSWFFIEKPALHMRYGFHLVRKNAASMPAL